MKKVLFMALVTVLTLCTGCSSSSRDSYSSPSYSSSYSTLESSSSYSSSEYSSYSTSTDYYDDYNNDYYDWYDDDYDWLEDITYADFVILCRDDIIDGAKNVTYQQLARSTDGMEGEYVKFKGEIIQVLDDYVTDYDCFTVLMNITYNYDNYFPYYSDTVIVYIMKDFVNMRPLVDDIITVWGVSTGLESYVGVLGDIKTEPSIVAAKVQFQNSGYGYGY